MKKLNNLEEINNIIYNSKISIIYFSGEKCDACAVIKNKVKNLLKRFPKIHYGEIDGEKNVEIAANFSIFSLPILLLYVDGKETIRVGRNINLLEVEEQIERYYEMIF